MKVAILLMVVVGVSGCLKIPDRYLHGGLEGAFPSPSPVMEDSAKLAETQKKRKAVVIETAFE